MVIESVVICLDNSDYMRNEDYTPSRLAAQCEAVDLIIQSKLGSHPENHVALIGFSTNRVITNLTTNETKLMTELNNIRCGGKIRFLKGLNVAQLVLKHRPVKTHKCRIIVFVGSPVMISETDVVTLGKKFKKENVALDVIRLGGEDGHRELEMLVATVNGNNGSGKNTYVSVPSNATVCNFLVSTNILSGSNRGTLQINEADDDEDLRRALELSLRDAENATPLPTTTSCPTGIQDGNALSDEEQLALAIHLSLQDAERGIAPLILPVAGEPPQNGASDKSSKKRKDSSPTANSSHKTNSDEEDAKNKKNAK